jgi:hypothetical protein
MASYRQKERQRTRTKGGRYSTLNPCEVCGKGAGTDYLSLPDCDRLGFGLVICRREGCGEEMERRAKAARK